MRCVNLPSVFVINYIRVTYNFQQAISMSLIIKHVYKPYIKNCCAGATFEDQYIPPTDYQLMSLTEKQVEDSLRSYQISILLFRLKGS